MEKFGTHPDANTPAKEQQDNAMAERIAETAQAFKKTLKWPHYVYRAMDNLGIKETEERKRLFTVTAALLRSRSKKQPGARTKYHSKNFTDAQMEHMIADSAEFEKRHPRDDDEEPSE